MGDYEYPSKRGGGGGGSRVGAVIAQVYATTFAGLAVAGLGAHVHMHPSAVPPSLRALPFTTASDAMTLAQCVGAAALLALGACRAHYALRLPVFLAVAWAAGLNTGSWLMKAMQELGLCAGGGWSFIPDLDAFAAFFGAPRNAACNTVNDLTVEAVALTAGIYFCFAAAALLSPRKYDWPAWVATALSVGLWIMFGTYALMRMELIKSSLFDAVYVRAGLVLYSLKTLYDTSVMVKRIEAGDDDVLGLALSQLLNFLQLLIRVVTILASSKKSSEKRRYD
jgi:FtsH-binding integral membrane protein